MRTDLGARMQIHAGAGMRPLGHNAWNERNVFEIEIMSEPLNGNPFHKRISDNNFFFAERSRVAVEGSLNVSRQYLSYSWEAVQKLNRQCMRDGTEVFPFIFLGRIVFEALVNFVFEAAQDEVEERSGFDFDFGGMYGLFVEKARKEQSQKINGYLSNRAFGRKIFSIQMVYAASRSVSWVTVSTRLNIRQVVMEGKAVKIVGQLGQALEKAAEGPSRSAQRRTPKPRGRRGVREGTSISGGAAGCC
jgi:hypothetical protein